MKTAKNFQVYKKHDFRKSRFIKQVNEWDLRVFSINAVNFPRKKARMSRFS